MQAAQADRKKFVKLAAGFGTAVSSLAATADAEAAIVILTPVPGTVEFTTVNFGASVDLGIPGEFDIDFYQYNDASGKSLIGNTSVFFPDLNIAGFRPDALAPGSTITVNQNFYTNFEILPSATMLAAQFVGFVTRSNQVGWIEVDPGGPGGDIVYLGAAFNNTPGGSIQAGAIPEPSSAALSGLAALALGAVTARRRKRQNAGNE